MHHTDQRRLVLVIDDERSVYESIKWTLIRGYDVEWARSLIESQRLLDSGTLSLVIVDLHLNGESKESGKDVALLLRFAYEHLPVIVLSGYLELDTVMELAAHGVRRFIPKPFDTAKLLRAVREEITEADKVGSFRAPPAPRRPRLWALVDNVGTRAVRYYKPLGVALTAAGSLWWLLWESVAAHWWRR